MTKMKKNLIVVADDDDAIVIVKLLNKEENEEEVCGVEEILIYGDEREWGVFIEIEGRNVGPTETWTAGFEKQVFRCC